MDVLNRLPGRTRNDGRSFARRPSIEPSLLVPMDKCVVIFSHSYMHLLTPFVHPRTSHIGGHDNFNVLFVGAGNIMFGAVSCYSGLGNL
jgi:hypothetical protein